MAKVAAGPRFLNGYTNPNAHMLAMSVAAGPRFLNGYTMTWRSSFPAMVAAGPRFLNGYTLSTMQPKARSLPLDRDF